ncbi:outer membrane beta-barrel protein [Pedobacter sp. N36a]|nr:outer membrane beta-barrel protein [Pedobacter sp. N36a]
MDRFGFGVINPFKNYVNPYFSTMGNANLSPQINHDMELFYSYKKVFVFGVSYTKTVGVIAPVLIPMGTNQIISTYENLPGANLFYMYANVPYRFFKWWSVNFSGGYGFYNYNTTEKQTLTSNKTWSYLGQLDFSFNFNNNFMIELSTFSRGPYASGINQTKGVSVINVGAKKSFSNNKFVLSANVSDVFNSNSTKQTTNYKGVFIDAKNKVESRFITVGLNYSFGGKKEKTIHLKNDKVEEYEKRM